MRHYHPDTPAACRRARRAKRITIVPQRPEDIINSCNACGAASYERQRDDYLPTGLPLFELRISPNGYMTTVTRLCPDCLRQVKRVITAALKKEG